MDLEDSELRHIERLARLSVGETSREKLREQLSKIIGFVQKLQEVDTSRYASIDERGIDGRELREDAAEACLARDEVLGESPATHGGFFSVPPVIESDGD